jgi:hypothetical protein
MTGEMPQPIKLDSPLIRALERLSPRDRSAMAGFTVDSRLGYGGSRTFHTASQALRWLKPSECELQRPPSAGWLIASFKKEITFDMLVQSCAKVPEFFEKKYGASNKSLVSEDIIKRPPAMRP